MIQLRGITWEHPRGYDSLLSSSTRYEEIEPGVTVRWEYRSLQAFADAPLEQLAAGYDLLVIDHPHVPMAAEDGLLTPLEGLGLDDELAVLASQSVGRSHESYAYRGHQYGLASDAAAQVAVYRPDLLAQPPTTWEQVFELADQGRVLWPAKPIDSYSSLITLAANAGAPPNETPGVFLAEEAALEALEVMHRLADLVPEQNLAQNPIEVAELLSGGDRWCYAPLLFGYTNYSRDGFRRHRLKYVDIPAGPRGVDGSLLGGAGIAVSAAASDVPAAAAFAVWVASAAAQTGVFFEAGGQPGNAAAWEDDATNAATWDFFRGTRDTLEGAYVRPRVPGYIEFQDDMSPLVTTTLRREITDQQLVRQLNDRAEALLGRTPDANS